MKGFGFFKRISAIFLVMALLVGTAPQALALEAPGAYAQSAVPGGEMPPEENPASVDEPGEAPEETPKEAPGEAPEEAPGETPPGEPDEAGEGTVADEGPAGAEPAAEAQDNEPLALPAAGELGDEAIAEPAGWYITPPYSVSGMYKELVEMEALPQRATMYSGNWAVPALAYQYVDASGGLNIVYADPESLQFHVYKYNASLEYQSKKTLSFGSMTIWGGAYRSAAGQIYVALGQSNTEENPDKTVVQVHKYDAEWNLLGTASIKAMAVSGSQSSINSVRIPFDCTVTSMEMVGNTLMLRMGRTMFKSDNDGLNHQASITYDINTTTMTAQMSPQQGSLYTSHSFNQLTAVSGADLFTADHGDGYPRALKLTAIKNFAGTRSVAVGNVMTIQGGIGENLTGVRMTGLAAGTNGVLMCGTSVPHDNAVNGVSGREGFQNVFLLVADRGTAKLKSFRWITTIGPLNTEEAATEPRLVKLGEDRFALLYNVTTGGVPKAVYQLLDSNGTKLAEKSFAAGTAFTFAGQPTVMGTKIVWTGFYTMRPYGPSDQLYLYVLDTANQSSPSLLELPRPVTSFTLNNYSVKTLTKGQTLQYGIENILPYNYDEALLTPVWSTSNPAVAAVSSAGLVTAVGAGTVTVTCTIGSVQASRSLEVLQPATGIELDETELTMYTGDEPVQLHARVLPANASNQSITWSSSNKSVATVSGGRVTPLARGSAVITAKSSGGLYSATCQVTVKSALTGMLLSKQALTVSQGYTGSVTMNLNPTAASGVTFEWSILSESTPGMISLTNTGAQSVYIQALTDGTAVVQGKATAHNGTVFTGTCEVTVPYVHVPVRVTGITLNESSITIYKGESFQLNADVQPDNADDRSVKWYSNASWAATVDDNGLVTGVSKNTSPTTITARTVDGNFSATCTVLVNLHPESISASPKNKTVAPGESFLLSAVASPYNATLEADWSNVTLLSESEQGVVSIEMFGRIADVTANKAGTAVLEVTYQIPGTFTVLRDTCTVTVQVPPTDVTLSGEEQRGQLYVGERPMQLAATVAPANTTLSEVVWSTSAPQVASVDENGLVTPLSYGRVTITAAMKHYPTIKASRTFNVFDPVEELVLSPASASMLKGSRRAISVSAKSSGSTYLPDEIEWTVLNESTPGVISFERESSSRFYVYVNALEYGTATLRAKVSFDGLPALYAMCDIVVGASVTGVKLAPDSYTLKAGQTGQDTVQLVPTVLPEQANNKQVTWRSSNAAVASVDSHGLVTGQSAGITTITVTTVDGRKTATSRITVTEDATGISISPTQATLWVGGYMDFTATPQPYGAAFTGPASLQVAEESEAGVVTVSGMRVHAQKAGTAIIKVAAAGKGGKVLSATATIYVNASGGGAITPQAILLDQYALRLQKDGEAATVGFNVVPDTLNEGNTIFYWRSSDDKIAKPSADSTRGVSGSIKIIPGAVGEAVITASAMLSTGGVQATAQITVRVAEDVTGVQIAGGDFALKPGMAKTLEVQPLPKGAALPDKSTVTWALGEQLPAADNEGLVALLDGATGSLTALGQGTAEVLLTVVVPDEEGVRQPETFTHSVRLTVKQGVDGLVFTGGECIVAEAGGSSMALGGLFTVQPEGIPLENYGGVRYATSNSKVFTVDAAGALKPGAVGAATLTATVSDEWTTYTRSVQVKLVRPLEADGLTLNKTGTVNLAAGKTLGLAVTRYNPADVSIAALEWHSSDESVATVAADGTVMAVAPGTAVVTASATDLLTPPNTATAGVTVRVTLAAGALALHRADGGALAPGETQRLVVPGSPAGLGAQTLSLKAVLTPENATDAVNWSSSKPGVATVEPDGRVKAVAPGSTTITAKAGGKKASVKVTVVVPVDAGALSFSDGLAEEVLALGTGKTLQVAVANTALTGGAKAPTNKKLGWKTNNDGIVTVTAGGTVRAVGVGQAQVTAWAQDDPSISITRVINVVAPVRSVELDQKAFTMVDGMTRALSLTLNGGGDVTPVNAEGDSWTTYKWTVPAQKDGTTPLLIDDAASPVPQVTAQPVAKAVTVKVSVQVTTDGYPTKTARVSITVLPAGSAYASPTDVDLTGKQPSEAAPLRTGQTLKPTVKVQPANAGNKNVTWTLAVRGHEDDADRGRPERFARLNRANGAVTGVAPSGDVVLVATARAVDNPAVKAEYTFRVVRLATRVSVAVTSGEFEGTAAKPVLRVAGTLSLGAQLEPVDVSGTAVRWRSSNAKVASVDDNGVVTTLKGGTATITATAADGSNKKGSLKLTVRQQVVDVVVTNTPENTPLTLNAGKTLKLKAKLNAEAWAPGEQDGKKAGAAKVPAPGNKTVSWEILGEYPHPHTAGQQVAPAGSVATLNAKTGVLKALGSGYVVVRVNSAERPGETFTGIPLYNAKTRQMAAHGNVCVVYVNVPAGSVRLEQASFALCTGGGPQTIMLSAATTPGLDRLTGAASGLAPQDILTWEVPAGGALVANGLNGAPANGGKTLRYTAPAGQGDIELTARQTTPGETLACKVTVRTAGGKAASLTLTLTGDEAAAPPLYDMVLSKDVTWLQKGKAETLKATLNQGLDAEGKRRPAPGDKNITWSIREYTAHGVPIEQVGLPAGSVAVVNANGKVTARGYGIAVVTAESHAPLAGGGKAVKSCKVYCLPKA